EDLEREDERAVGAVFDADGERRVEISEAAKSLGGVAHATLQSGEELHRWKGNSHQTSSTADPGSTIGRSLRCDKPAFRHRLTSGREPAHGCPGDRRGDPRPGTPDR